MKTFTPREQQWILHSLVERALIKSFRKTQAQQRQDFTIVDTSKVESTAGWDAIIISSDTRYLVEAKVRGISSLDYPSSKINKKKYDYLMANCRRAEVEGEMYEPIYMVFYTDGRVALFPLYDINPVWRSRPQRQFNAVTTNNPVIQNIEYDIPNNLATWYNYDNTPSVSYRTQAIITAELMWPNQNFQFNQMSE